MKQWWNTLSMGSKLHILIQVMLVVILLAAQAWIMERFRVHILEAAESRALVTADGVINGMNMLMLTGTITDTENRKLYIRKMSASAGIKELRIIRGPPVQRQFGPGLPQEQPLDELDHKVLASGKLEWMRSDDSSGNPQLRVVVPFIAQHNFRGTNCLRCHQVPEGAVNGAASIVLDLREDYAMIGRISALLWSGQIALQLLLLFLSGWFIRNITRPLKNLQTVMAEIQKNGGLALHHPKDNLHVPVQSQDEIGKLIVAFNQMARTLHEQMNALHAAQDAQQRYLLQTREEQARMVALLGAMNIGILLVSRDNKVIYSNPAFFGIWQIPLDIDLVGIDASTALDHAAVRITNAPFNHSALLSPNTNANTENCELRLDDDRIVTQFCYEVRDSERNPVGWLWVFEDVTAERQTAEQLTYLAERDALTGLYNRHRFQEELARTLAYVQRSQALAALLFFDLDGFKYVNDTFGHSAGDAILIRVASEMSAQIRKNESLFRLGGDEFAILVPNTTEEEVRKLAERVVHTVAKISFQFEGCHLQLTASLGIALFPQHAANANELMAQADAAMYQSKAAGKNTWGVYHPANHSTP